MTTLTAVDKFQANGNAKAQYELGAEDVNSLVAVYTNASSCAPSGSDQKRVLEVLGKLTDKGAWLACACKCTDLSHSPILYPQKTRGGSRTLVRNYDRTDHDEGCPFYRMRSENKDAPSRAKRDPMSSTFHILEETKQSSPGTVTDIENAQSYTGTTRTPKLARILFTVLEKAGLNIVSNEHPLNIREQYEALKKALKNFHFDRACKHCVGDYTETDLASLGRLCVRLRNSGDWPSPLVPQGFLIGVAKELDGKTLVTTRDERLDVEGRLIRPGEDTPGPYIAIVLVGKPTGESRYTALQAFVHPVKSASLLMPVDSNLERKTLEILTNRQKYQQNHASFQIVKPLTDIKIGDPVEAVRPDFILEYANHKVVVETMGYSDAEYLARKQRTHSAMATIGKVITHSLESDADVQLRKAINQSMFSQ